MRPKLRNLRFLNRTPVSLRSRLILLVLATLAPLIIFAVLMIFRLSNQERLTFQRGAIERTRALLTAIDTHLKSSIAPLVALATSPSLDAETLTDFYGRAAGVLKSQPDWVTLTLAHPSGQQVMDVRVPLGSALAATPVDRESFEQVVRTKKPALGSLIQDPVTGKYKFNVRVPVLRNGAIAYILSAQVQPASLNEVLTSQKLPPGWIGAVLDGNRRLVARTVEQDRHIGRLAAESLRAAVDRAPEGWFHGNTLEGWDVYMSYNRSSFSGWSVAVGIPAAVVEGTFRRSMIDMAFFGGGLLALGLLIAWILSTRTAASIQSLAMMAQELVPGKKLVVEKISSGISEVEAVREAFVTANRLLREQSLENERIAGRLQLALHAGEIGAHEWNPQTHEIIWDDRVRAHWGLAPGRPINYEVFRQGVHPEDRLTLRDALNRALDPKSDGQYHTEFRVIGIEDHVERWIEARGQVLFEDGRAIRLSGATIDVTQRKAFQAELERQVQERTMRLQESIGELEAFSYSVSHDMRAPLRAMEGYANALRADYSGRLDAEAQHWLDRISRSAHRLDSLIKDVLAYSRVAKEEIELTTVDLEGLIDDIVSANPEFQSPRAEISVQRPLHRVLGHEAYLTQCLTNLLGNAVKFVAAGVIPKILIGSERLDGKVRLWLEDNGIGIDPAHYDRIFQMFGQVYPEARYSGTGIGLAIVRKAVQRMNGEVGVDSSLEKGSRFWLILHGEKNDR